MQRGPTSQLFYQTADAIPARHELLLIPGPVLDKGQPLDRRAIDKTPETAVVRTVAIVAHDKIIVRRHFDQRHVVAWTGSDVAILVDRLRCNVSIAINIDVFVANLDAVAGQAYDTLDKITAFEIGFVFIFGKFEDDDISTLRVANRQNSDLQ